MTLIKTATAQVLIAHDTTDTPTIICGYFLMSRSQICMVVLWPLPLSFSMQCVRFVLAERFSIVHVTTVPHFLQVFGLTVHMLVSCPADVCEMSPSQNGGYGGFGGGGGGGGGFVFPPSEGAVLGLGGGGGGYKGGQGPSYR